MKRKNFTGRAASLEEKHRAAELADLLRRAQSSPNGEVCINPEDPQEERSYWTLDNLHHELENFATHGRFLAYESSVDPYLFIRAECKVLFSDGMSRTETIKALSKNYFRSEKHIERIIKGIRVTAFRVRRMR